VEEKKKVLAQIEELKKNDPFADPEHANDNAAIDTDAREQMEHQTIEVQTEEMKRRMKDMDIALGKISKKQYGRCERCDNYIATKRLELIPEARFCIDCERKIRK
jgi:RNA polymerase-binding transcription factor DksA